LKSLVQLTIWGTISFWLTCLMVINTVVYNGFATGNRISDGNLRLFLVLTYAFSQLIFSCYTVRIYRKVYGYVISQACWVVLTKLFVFANREEFTWWDCQQPERYANVILSNYA